MADLSEKQRARLTDAEYQRLTDLQSEIAALNMAEFVLDAEERKARHERFSELHAELLPIQKKAWGRQRFRSL